MPSDSVGKSTIRGKKMLTKIEIAEELERRAARTGMLADEFKRARRYHSNSPYWCSWIARQDALMEAAALIRYGEAPIERPKGPADFH